MLRLGHASLVTVALCGLLAVGCNSEEPAPPSAASEAKANEAAGMWTDEQKANWKKAAAESGLADQSAGSDGEDLKSR